MKPPVAFQAMLSQKSNRGEALALEASVLFPEEHLVAAEHAELRGTGIVLPSDVVREQLFAIFETSPRLETDAVTLMPLAGIRETLAADAPSGIGHNCW